MSAVGGNRTFATKPIEAPLVYARPYFADAERASPGGLASVPVKRRRCGGFRFSYNCKCRFAAGHDLDYFII
jgi:hypothetical protein